METKSKWYQELIAHLNDLATELGLNEDETERMRQYVLSIAKDQYMQGNRAGIYWARTQSNNQKEYESQAS